ncbi:MAG: hypothetical protein PHH64_03445 [Proteiniphilum sp.]|nr:hypothetical protein [Proteiniphilum sp.]MDD4158445.1 hypothetical protein [Proteiniphilum sp.]MDD4799414.1 hypothetical protein [Proteiniphilum sp.]
MKSRFNKLEEIDRSGRPFKVPENYFARLNEEIMNRLPEKEPVQPRRVPLWDKVKPWVYMAAMFVGLYITIQFLTKQSGIDNMASRQPVVQPSPAASSQPGNNGSAGQITEEEFYQYLEDQLTKEGYFDYMYDHYYLN